MAYNSKKRKGKYGKSHTPSPAMGVIIALFVLCGFLYSVVWGEGFEPWTSPTSLGEEKAYFHFIDVGQGDATLITSGEGAVVIDVGGVAEGERVADYINTYTESVDYLILTHPHEDHMGAAATVLRHVDVKNVILPAAVSDAAFYRRFLEAAEELETNVIEAVAGDVYHVGEITLTLLGPLDSGEENLNNASVVTRVEVGDTAALFTGDAEWEVEEALLARYPTELDCDLYQAGHHGSSTSNARMFMEVVTPSAAVISCGKDNSYGHPHRETLSTFADLGIEVFRTDTDGDVIFVSDGVGILPY